jgi:hypothetical protein
LAGFLANLAVDSTFRKFIAADEFLDQVVELVRTEVEKKNFDWIDSIEKELGVLINVATVKSVGEFLTKVGF